MADFEKLVHKAINDESFAQELVSNPDAALRSEGIDPTPEMLDALNGVDVASIKQLAATFGENKAGL
jgi:hypothetical protein